MTKTVTTGKATDLITFTRSTTGTYLDSVKYGDELVTNGTFDTDSDWIFQTGKNWTISNGKLNAANSTGYTKQNGVVENNKTYKVTVDAIVTSGSFRMVTTADASTYTSYITTSGSYVFIISPVSSASGGFEFIGSGFTGSIDNVSVKEIIGNQGASGEPLLRTADTNEPRIEYDADGNLKGLLIEEQRTNDVTQSEDLTTWSKASGGAVVANQTIAPDGTKTADEMVGVVYKAINIGSSTRAFSVYLKANAGTTAQVRIDVPASQRIIVDLTDGSVPFSTGDFLDSYDVVDAGNGWYRCHIVVTGAINNYVIVGEANDASHTVYAWGAQLEAGSFPTSYIPTSGSTVTRNADVATINVSEFEYNQFEGTVFIDWTTLGYSTDYNSAVLYGGVSNARWVYSIISSTTHYSYDGANSLVHGNISAKQQTRLAMSADSTTQQSSINGGAIASESHNGNITSNTSVFNIGHKYNTADFLTGHVKSIKYYPVRLTNNQLKALTQ